MRRSPANPLTALNIFFPLLDAVVFVTDLITAVLLFSQFSIAGSRALLALANGYLFTGLIVIPHALTFSGAFSPTGLLGANIQTGSWLFIFWHIGFSASLLAYAVLAIDNRTRPLLAAKFAIRWSVVGVVVLTCGLTWLATAGTHLLPPIILDSNRISPLVVYPIWFAILFAAAAIAVLALRRRSVLNQWLMVVAFVYIGELAFSGLFASVRFSLGFYAGQRVFSVITASIVLIVLLAETTRLYVLLARSNMKLQSEQNNKLMTFEAIAASISHEMKQPLGLIELNTSSAQLILDQAPVDVGEIRAIIDETRDAAQRINETLDGLRFPSFGRIDRKRLPVDMNELILDVLKSSRTELNHHGVVVRTKLAAELPVIHGDASQLHQLIYNLVHNAIEAMSESKLFADRMLEVRTDIWDRHAIIVEVLDNGPGIDAGRLTEVFEAFVTTKPHGMGLGLAICRKIVERHDGQIWASSVEPHGAHFQIVLRSSESAYGDHASPMPHTPASGTLSAR